MIEQGLENTLVLQAETRKKEEGNGEMKRGEWLGEPLPGPVPVCFSEVMINTMTKSDWKGSLWLTGPNDSASQRGAKAGTQAGKASGIRN